MADSEAFQPVTPGKGAPEEEEEARAMFNAWLLRGAAVCRFTWGHSDRSNRLFCIPPAAGSRSSLLAEGSREPSGSVTHLTATCLMANNWS